MHLLYSNILFTCFSITIVLCKNSKRTVPTEVPTIYNFISNNAYICSPVELPDGSLVTFLNEEEGKECVECNHASLGFGNACGVRIAGNVTDSVSCFEVPPLCIEAFELRYAAGTTHTTTKKPKKRLITEDTSNVEKEVENDLKRSRPLPTLPTVSHEIAVSATLTTPKKSPFSQITESLGKSENDIAHVGSVKIKRFDQQKNAEMILLNKKKLMFIGTTTTTSTPKPTLPPCEDKHSLCCFWATTGECTRNPFWMRVNCAKTCGTCNCPLGSADKCVSTGIHCTFTTTTRRTTTTTTTTPKPTPTTTQPTTPTTTKKKYTRPYTPPSNGFRRTQATTTIKLRENPTTTTSTTTTTLPPTTTVPTTTTDVKCKDYHNECHFWAMLGECRTNPFYMLPNCQKSCKSCGEQVDTVYAPTPRPGCDNGHQLCNYWAHIGECSSNANYMLPNCRLACRVC